ncbi:hypothetical protein [Streptomyces sp. ISL-1]|uniref:hypothetical protein n=1 Tax=Streptomyces sp. ISL-1 TaxID=2817657 RepID=UPI002035B001|nr:hypothetical protein [Streptomyces sp. ISL-1]
MSLSASRLKQRAEERISKDRLRTHFEEDYESSATYNQKLKLVEELYAFLSRMKPGDPVCTISGGQLYVGEITGGAEEAESDDRRSNLRRHVEWPPATRTRTCPKRRRSCPSSVVDHTFVHALIEGLGPTDEELADEAKAIERDPSAEIPAITARRELELSEPTDQLADELLVHDPAWLCEVRDLFWDERQLVMYSRHQQDLAGAQARGVSGRRARAGEARPPGTRDHRPGARRDGRQALGRSMESRRSHPGQPSSSRRRLSARTAA